MENLEITFYLKTPIAMNSTSRYPLCLDALLMAVAAGRLDTAIDPAPGVYEEVPIPLAKDPTETFYRASAIAVLAPREYGTDSWVQSWCEGIEEHLRGKQIETSRGPFRSKNDPLTLIYTPAVRFWAVGDAERVASLLSKVQSIGVRRSVGYGRIARRTMALAKYDYSVIDPDGSPARPLPVENYPGVSEGWEVWRAAYKPPYWRPENFGLCYMPPAYRWLPTKKGDEISWLKL